MVVVVVVGGISFWGCIWSIRIIISFRCICWGCCCCWRRDSWVIVILFLIWIIVGNCSGIYPYCREC